jgi:3-keto-5-aminohexanoate cleavage enzyme
MEKLMITAAVTGSRNTKDVSPHIPITPEEIAQSCIECWRAGASIVHIHVRDLETGLGTQDYDLYKRVVDPVREQTDLILSLTTSGTAALNLPHEDRLIPLAFNPELASFDAGSINLGGGVFSNPPDFLDLAAEKMLENGVKPEIEVFDLGMAVTALNMNKKGQLESPMYFQFVMGTPWGAPSTPKVLLHLLEHIPEESVWSVIGIGKSHLPMSMMALIMGGHIRVGLEDNVYYERGVLAKNSAVFVERIIRLAKEYGREVATPNEARKILGVSRQGE